MAKTPKHQLPADHRKHIVRTIQRLSHRHSVWHVFADFCEMSALAIANAVDWPQRDAREAEYLRLVKRYTKEEMAEFPAMYGALVEAMEPGAADDLAAYPSGRDVLGGVFHELELHNHWTGQYFTPYSVARMMAEMTVHDATTAIIAERGYVTAQEPACGSGVMVIALADALAARKINYQQSLHVTAVDVDIKCVHMAYVQFSLLHIPAVIVHGNSLTLEEHSHWYTPAHIMGLWGMKLFRERAEAPPPLDADQVVAPFEQRRVAAESEKPAKGKKAPSQLTLF